MRYLPLLCASLLMGASLVAQSVTVIPGSSRLNEIDMDNAGVVGPVTLAAINGAGTPNAANIAALTLTPTTAAAGVYNTNPQGLALGLLNGGLELIPPPSGAFDAFDASIDLSSPATEFGLGVGDWVGAMALDFYRNGSVVASFTTPSFSTAAPYQVYQVSAAFDRVDISTSSGGGNWVITQLGIEDPNAPASYGILGVAEPLPGAGTLGSSAQSFADLDWLRWNYDDFGGAYAGRFGAVIVNIGNGGPPPIGSSAIPGFDQVWALSTPAGQADIFGPALVGAPDFATIVPPGLFTNGDTVRIQGLLLVRGVGGAFPVVASLNTITFTYNNCPNYESFDSIATGVGSLPTGWANGGGIQQWSAQSGGTSSSGTGPTGAFSGANYLYCETSGPAAGDTYIFNTKVYSSANLTGVVDFQLSRIGATMGTLEVRAGDGSGTFPAVMATYSGPDLGQSQGGVEWGFESIDLTQGSTVPLPPNVQLQFIYTRGTSFTGDVAIDDFCVR